MQKEEEDEGIGSQGRGEDRGRDSLLVTGLERRHCQRVEENEEYESRKMGRWWSPVLARVRL